VEAPAEIYLTMMDTKVAIDGKSAAARSAIGIVLMSVASLVVPVVDGIAKLLGSSHSPYLVAWARYAVASLIVLPLTLIWYRSAYGVRRDLASNVLRTMLTVGAMTCFFFAITEIPLASPKRQINSV